MRTTHAGMTLLLPRPSLPSVQSAYCRYAALRKLSIVKLNSSALISHLALMHTSSISRSRQILLNELYDVIQVRFLQQTFSCSVSIGLQIWHWHQGGCSPGGDGWSGAPGATAFFAKSRLPLPMLSSLHSSSTSFSRSKDSTNSYSQKQKGNNP